MSVVLLKKRANPFYKAIKGVEITGLLSVDRGQKGPGDTCHVLTARAVSISLFSIIGINALMETDLCFRQYGSSKLQSQQWNKMGAVTICDVWC